MSEIYPEQVDEFRSAHLERAQAQAVDQLADRLLTLGDAHVLGLEVGERAAAQAMQWLIERSPMEIQESWPLVVAYHRHGRTYKRAHRMGDMKAEQAATDAQMRVITDRY